MESNTHRGDPKKMNRIKRDRIIDVVIGDDRTRVLTGEPYLALLQNQSSGKKGALLRYAKFEPKSLDGRTVKIIEANRKQMKVKIVK